MIARSADVVSARGDVVSAGGREDGAGWRGAADAGRGETGEGEVRLRIRSHALPQNILNVVHRERVGGACLQERGVQDDDVGQCPSAEGRRADGDAVVDAIAGKCRGRGGEHALGKDDRHLVGRGARADESRRRGVGDADGDWPVRRGRSIGVGDDSGEVVDAVGGIAPDQTVGSGGVRADAHAAGEELDAGHAFKVARGGGERNVLPGGEAGPICRLGQRDGRRQVCAAGQFQVHGDIRTVHGALMHFDGNDVGAEDECAGADVGEGEKSRAIVGGTRRGEGRTGDGTGWHVVTQDLGAVEIDDDAVVALDAQVQRGDEGGVGDDERAAEIRGDVFARRVRTEAHACDDPGIGIAQRSAAAEPRVVIEGQALPVLRAEIHAGIEVFPGRQSGDELALGRCARAEGREAKQGEEEGGELLGMHGGGALRCGRKRRVFCR